MTIALLQANRANSASAVASIHVAFSSPVTPGSLLIAYAWTTAGGRTWTASDTVNGAYNVDIGPGTSQAILSFPNTAAGTPDVTITVSGAAAAMAMIIEEWSGILTTSPKDQTQSSSNTSNTTATTGTTASLSQTNELVVAMMGLGGSSGALPFQVSSPFTVSTFSPAPNTNAAILAAGYFLPGGSTAGQVATFTWTTSNTSKGAIATYKSIPTGAAPPPFYNRRNVLYFI